MKLPLTIAVIACASFVASAQAPIKSCEVLKDEIAKKLDAKSVKDYTLTIVDKGKEADGKVVGNCGGGSKSIVYTKAAPAAKPKPADKKPK